MTRFFYDLEDRFAGLADERRGTVRGVAAICLRNVFACLGDMARMRPDSQLDRSPQKAPVARD